MGGDRRLSWIVRALLPTDHHQLPPTVGLSNGCVRAPIITQFISSYCQLNP